MNAVGTKLLWTIDSREKLTSVCHFSHTAKISVCSLAFKIGYYYPIENITK